MKFSFHGLSEQEVQQSRQTHGSNEVSTQEAEGFLDKLWKNFQDPIIIILIVALVVTVILSVLGFAPWYEGVGIFLAVILATLVATASEYSNESQFQKLVEEASQILVKTFREHKLLEIPIGQLVVADEVLLQPGDTVPADGQLVAGYLELNQSALTGESKSVKKIPIDSNSGDQEASFLLRASLVDDGEAVMKITHVGDQTQYGQTLKELLSAEDRLSPLQEKLTILGKQISRFGYFGAIFIAMAFMFNHVVLQSPSVVEYFEQPIGITLHHFVTAIILAIIVIVVAVPEGLPMMIAVVLSLNMKKLLNAKVLVRKLLGIETAGSLTVLFTDKTGTLTQGQLVVADVVFGDASHGKSFADLSAPLQQQIAFALRNNTSAVVDTADLQNPRIVGANPTEQSLLRFVTPLLAEKDTIKIVNAIAFNSARKFSATQVTGDQNLTLLKGAADMILKNCSTYLSPHGEKKSLDQVELLQEEMQKLSNRAMRLLAVAVTDQGISESLEMPSSLTLLAIFGIRDELRAESPASIQSAREAGIQMVMITGDAKETAQSIARDVGLLHGGDGVIMTSTDLAQLSDAELKQTLPKLAVVARAFPTDKSRLVKAAKELNWVVGMTGDGVNDAPAVKNADVGFAMGSGTEMTKESSDIVIMDDNISSIIRAILYGRTLLKSIQKFLVFQLSVSLAAVLVAFIGPFFGTDLPFTMTQLLWVNLIIDTLAAIAFAGEPALRRYLNEKPIPKDFPLITKDMWSAVLTGGISMAVLSLFFLTSSWVASIFRNDKDVLLTAFFGFFVFMNNFNKFNPRTEGYNLFEHMGENKSFIWVTFLIFGVQIFFTTIGGDIFRTVPLSLTEWGYITLASIIIIPIDLIRKWIRDLVF